MRIGAAYAGRAQPRLIIVSQRLSDLADTATIAGMVLYFLVSAMLLQSLGLNYEASGGSVLEKIHPGTWLILGAFVLKALAFGNPLRFLALIAERRPELVFAIATWSLLLLQAAIVQRIPFTIIIDTFLPCFLLVPLVLTMAARTRALAEPALHGVMLANALLGLIEFVSGFRLTPFYAGTVLIDWDWRSTALLGHPLANAITTGFYAVVLARGGGSISTLPRLALIGVQIVAMVAFGGRAALVLMMLILGLSMLGPIRRALTGARLDRRWLALGCFALPLFGFVAFVLIDGGFLDRLLLRFVSDDGSAGTRIAMFRLFAPFPLRDLLLGPDPALLSTLRTIEGLEYGIESFPVAMVLTYGLLASGIFFLGLAAFSWVLIRETRAGTLTALLFFFAVAATSTSLASKSIQLAQATALVLILLPKRREGRVPAN